MAITGTVTGRKEDNLSGAVPNHLSYRVAITERED
jgi:hypothetical protein